jgi:hypothetical protein
MSFSSDPQFVDSPVNYTQSGLAQLREFILKEGGLRDAALRGNVYESTLRKILFDKPISNYARQKVENFVGPLVTPYLYSSHSPTSSGVRPHDERRSGLSELTGLVSNLVAECGGNLQAAGRLGIRESTIGKVLTGQRISESVARRILKRLKTCDFSPSIDSSRAERLREVHRLYEELGTLESVGQKLGLTR